MAIAMAMTMTMKLQVGKGGESDGERKNGLPLNGGNPGENLGSGVVSSLSALEKLH